MTLREAAQMALDLIEGEFPNLPEDRAYKAITALRTALAEPEQEPVSKLKRGITGRCTRKRCECEIEGLGLECIHLEPLVDGYPLWSGIPKPDDTALLRQCLDALESDPNAMVEVEPAQWEYKRVIVATALRERLEVKV
jgi:hypothetical protein